MKKIVCIVLIVSIICLPLASCTDGAAMLERAERYAALQAELRDAKAKFDKGELSMEQVNRINNELLQVRHEIGDAGKSGNWERILEILGSAGLSLLGVRVWRGGINSRKGTLAEE